MVQVLLNHCQHTQVGSALEWLLALLWADSVGRAISSMAAVQARLRIHCLSVSVHVGGVSWIQTFVQMSSLAAM